MKIYHGFKDVPELAGLSRSERRKVLRACFFRYGFRDWPLWVALLAQFVFILAGDMTGVVLRYGFGYSETVDYACAFVGLKISATIYTLMYYSVVIDHLRPRFRDYIAAGRLHS